MPDLLIITNSYDATTDILLNHLGEESVFRFNFDCSERYSLRIDADGFLLSDEMGRSVSHQSISKAYWRKPFSAGPETETACPAYVAAELRYALTELVNFLWTDRKLVLVEPFAEKRTGKLLQLRYAQSFFDVPAYEFVSRCEAAQQIGVVKSLSSELVNEKVLFTTRVTTGSLARDYPWFVEQEIEAIQDVTIVFVRGQLFAFSLERSFLAQSVDWRQISAAQQQWREHTLPQHFELAVQHFMAALRLDYGRLDFLLDSDQRYWFCEVNPNGQFAWLDLQDERGVLSCVAAEISPETAIHPLQNRHVLDRYSTPESVVPPRS